MSSRHSHSVFAVELHSAQPEQLVSFYERVLSVKFVGTSYPCLRYVAEFDRVALIISDARSTYPETASDPGKVTLSLLSSMPPAAEMNASRYFLYPKRPIARTFPERHALRLRDPDGHYVALAASMEDVLGRVPPVQTIGALLDCIREFVSLRGLRLRLQMSGAASALLDLVEYATSTVTILRRDLRGYSHVVACGEGLFVVNEHTYRRVVRGNFFGMTIKDGDLYCFQSCGRSHSLDNRGRLLRLKLDHGRIRGAEILATGLDDGCHQIDFVGEQLLVVDCYNGRLLAFGPDMRGYDAHYPVGQLSRARATEVHMNSVVAHPDGTIWVLLHQSSTKHSEVVVLDRAFTVRRRFPIDGGNAHNIVFTGDSCEYLIADSRGGRVIAADRPVVDGGMLMPRGISLDDTTCVVGDAFFSTRPFRRFVPGRVHFFDRRTWTRRASLTLPAAPKDVRRIDGRDLSLSNHFAARASGIRESLAVTGTAVCMALLAAAGVWAP